jgi:hypothetical protein
MADEAIKDVPFEEMMDPGQQPPPPPPMDDKVSDQVRKARDVIPVDERGFRPETFGQWIDIAKDMCKATLMLPEHLHHNAPVMAGLLEIASRFRLSPYMLASQTYVQNERLCFQAQAFGAILYASGLLIGRLRFDFNGEGEDMTCTVSGRFRDDPDVIHTATTPTLKQLHPGHITKTKDGQRFTFVKGSPLWDRDAEQQLGYFGERRWIRRHAPDACMGMYTREELMDIDGYRVERDGAIPLSADRLGQLDTGEGWGDGTHVDVDLASIQPEPKPEPEPVKPPRSYVNPGRKGAAPPAKRPAKLTKPKLLSPKTRPVKPPKPPRAQPPTNAQVKAAAKRAEKPPAPRTAPIPKWVDYVTRTEEWIKGMGGEEAGTAEGRWEGEREERDKSQVPIGERSRLRALLDRKVTQLALKEPK